LRKEGNKWEEREKWVNWGDIFELGTFSINKNAYL
jgi:hypothetical protein